jgi:regulator of sirC expression with transglutaminase-like and TPR domain
MARRLGLIVGANQYRDEMFQPLQFAENDARALAQWLVNAKGGKWLPSDVQLVLGEHATRELVEALLVQMCVTLAEPGDLVLVYFAGHAYVDERNAEGYLALVNTHYQEPTTAIHLPSLAHSLLARSRASHILFILDCFQTGDMWSVHRTSPYDFKPLLGSTLTQISQQSNGLFFCSCRGNEMAKEAGERNLGLFMYRMIIGLCGPAVDSTTGSATLQQLNAFLAKMLGEQQRPHLFGKEHYPLVLIGELPTIPELQPVSSSINSSSPFPPPLFMRQHSGAQHVEATVGSFATATVSSAPVSAGRQFYSEQNSQQQGRLLLSQAQQLLQMQNAVEALHVVEQALQVIPQDVETLTLKCQILGTLGRFQEALTVVEQLLQLDPNKALSWSMRAGLLTNIGQYQPALAAVERSLQLDPQNPETHAIKKNIMEHLATTTAGERARAQNQAGSFQKKQGGPRSFFIGVVLQVAGVVLGLAGGRLLITSPHLPAGVALALESFGMALLCVNAARGAYRHGILRLLVTLLMCLVSVGILGAIYKLEYNQLVTEIKAKPPLLVSVLFLAVWLALAAILPLVLAIGGYIGGLLLGVRRRTK